MRNLCGLDCGECGWKEHCAGKCAETGGHPYGGSCMIAQCCGEKGCENCGKAFEAPCRLKERLIAEFNALHIEDMEEVTGLNALLGSYVNLQYTLPGGQAVKVWDDNRIYLGNQMHKINSERCYGLTADEHYLIVCEYGCNGSDAEIIVFKKWS